MRIKIVTATSQLEQKESQFYYTASPLSGEVKMLDAYLERKIVEPE
jgi:hypothetical protein